MYEYTKFVYMCTACSRTRDDMHEIMQHQREEHGGFVQPEKFETMVYMCSKCESHHGSVANCRRHELEKHSNKARTADTTANDGQSPRLSNHNSAENKPPVVDCDQANADLSTPTPTAATPTPPLTPAAAPVLPAPVSPAPTPCPPVTPGPATITPGPTTVTPAPAMVSNAPSAPITPPPVNLSEASTSSSALSAESSNSTATSKSSEQRSDVGDVDSRVPSLSNYGQLASRQDIDGNVDELSPNAPIVKKARLTRRGDPVVNTVTRKSIRKMNWQSKLGSCLVMRQLQKDMFKDRVFVVTWNSEEEDTRPLWEREVIYIIESLGGAIVDNMDVDDAVTKNALLAGRAYCISDTYYRTTKYLTCLAAGAILISYSWIFHLVTQGEILPIDDYLLPAGVHLDSGAEVKQLPHDTAVRRASPFGSVRIVMDNGRSSRGRLLYASPLYAMWKPILAATGGAHIVDTPEEKNTRTAQVYAVVDEDTKQRFIERCRAHDIPLLTPDWLIACLIHNTLIDPADITRFTFTQNKK